MEAQPKRSMRQHCALKHGIFKEFLAEFLGTFVLVVSSIFCVSFFVEASSSCRWCSSCLSLILSDDMWSCCPVLLCIGSCLAAAQSLRPSWVETPSANLWPSTSVSQWASWWRRMWLVECQVNRIFMHLIASTLAELIWHVQASPTNYFWSFWCFLISITSVGCYTLVNKSQCKRRSTIFFDRIGIYSLSFVYWASLLPQNELFNTTLFILINSL